VNVTVGAGQRHKPGTSIQVSAKRILGGDSFIAMVQPADLRNRYNRPGLHRLNWSCDRGVLRQREMRAGSLVVVEVGLEDAS